MAVWFGHTQTLTSISKSVSTVASGIMGLEANLATFMQKVTYYDKFFQRVGVNLPPEVLKTAARLFARCYEYRDEIRDELESSLAYVADAGRWVIGMEDWNSKMEKRLAQISELVLLTNTLLVEFTLTGKWGAVGAKNELDAYLRTIADSVVLHNGQTPSSNRSTASTAKPTTQKTIEEEFEEEEDDNPLFPRAKKTVEAQDEQENPLFPQATGSPPVSTTGAKSARSTDSDEELFIARSSVDAEADSADSSALAPVDATGGGEDEDDDVLNPFARAYQPPVSVESSLASLRAESDNGSVYFNALDSQQASQITVSGDRDADFDDSDGPDSPVSLGEYECLDIDSIPQYVAFKPSVMSRKRRLKQQYNQFFTGPSTSPSESIESLRSAPAPPPQRSPRASPRANGRKSPVKDRQRLMDLNYSYDFQSELNFNPFASPGMAPTASEAANTPPAMELSMRRTVSTVEEEDEMPKMQPIPEQSFGHERQLVEEPPYSNETERVEPVKQVEQVESLEPLEPLGSLEPLEPLEPLEQLEQVESVVPVSETVPTPTAEEVHDRVEDEDVELSSYDGSLPAGLSELEDDEEEEEEEEEDIPHITASFNLDMLLTPQTQSEDEQDELSRLLHLDESPEPHPDSNEVNAGRQRSPRYEEGIFSYEPSH